MYWITWRKKIPIGTTKCCSHGPTARHWNLYTCIHTAERSVSSIFFILLQLRFLLFYNWPFLMVPYTFQNLELKVKYKTLMMARPMLSSKSECIGACDNRVQNTVRESWLVWLSGLSASIWPKGWNQWVACSIPSLGHIPGVPGGELCERQPQIDVSLSFTPPSPL